MTTEIDHIVHHYETVTDLTRGDTLLHYAAAADNTEDVRLLIDADFDVNARNRWGATPLVVTTSPEVTHELVANRAKVRACSRGAMGLHRSPATRFTNGRPSRTTANRRDEA